MNCVAIADRVSGAGCVMVSIFIASGVSIAVAVSITISVVLEDVLVAGARVGDGSDWVGNAGEAGA